MTGPAPDRGAGDPRLSHRIPAWHSHSWELAKSGRRSGRLASRSMGFGADSELAGGFGFPGEEVGDPAAESGDHVLAREALHFPRANYRRTGAAEDLDRAGQDGQPRRVALPARKYSLTF